MRSQGSLVTEVMVHILQIFYCGVITLRGKEGRLPMSDVFWDLRTQFLPLFFVQLCRAGKMIEEFKLMICLYD